MRGSRPQGVDLSVQVFHKVSMTICVAVGGSVWARARSGFSITSAAQMGAIGMLRMLGMEALCVAAGRKVEFAGGQR